MKKFQRHTHPNTGPTLRADPAHPNLATNAVERAVGEERARLHLKRKNRVVEHLKSELHNLNQIWALTCYDCHTFLN